ncbi:hypothetical protein AB0L71_10425 [Streptomyces sp. NPDC052052]|uniref:hypothetical protein n=1 Tax=Streptomyces sp. NPDC052052 TaxID=3154756 RepID=UPI00344672A5
MGRKPGGARDHRPVRPNVAAFLASDLSGYVNGLMIPVDGGASAMTQSSFAKDILEVRDAFIAG